MQQGGKTSQHQTSQRMHSECPCRLATDIPHLVDDVGGPRDQVNAVAQIGLPHLTESNNAGASVKQRRPHMVF